MTGLVDARIASAVAAVFAHHPWAGALVRLIRALLVLPMTALRATPGHHAPTNFPPGSRTSAADPVAVRTTNLCAPLVPPAVTCIVRARHHSGPRASEAPEDAPTRRGWEGGRMQWARSSGRLSRPPVALA